MLAISSLGFAKMRWLGPALVLLALIPGCCPPARPARESGKADSSNQTLQILAGLLAERNGTSGAAQEPSNEGRGKRDREKELRKQAAKEPDAAGGPASEPSAGEDVPKPRLTREMIEKSKANAVGAITPESADEQLELLKEELGTGSTTGEPDAAGAEPPPGDELESGDEVESGDEGEDGKDEPVDGGN